MVSVKAVYGRQIIDSRGNPTVEAEVSLSDGSVGRGVVPSGASTGSHEALEKRDKGQAYCGRGVRQAVASVNGSIADAVKGQHADLQSIDRCLIDLDGSDSKSTLGANAILAVSMGLCRAVACSKRLETFEFVNEFFPQRSLSLPVPMVNILNGGAHANNSVDFQEIMIVPIGFDDFSECLQCSAEVFHALGKLLGDQGHQTTVGDEGGFAPNLESNRAAIELVSKAVEIAGYRLGEQVFLALDIAASEFFRDGLYHLSGEGKTYDSASLIDFFSGLCGQFPIVSIEDGLDENDWTGWRQLTETLGQRVQLVGDDLFVTNVDILRRGIKQKTANSMLVKVNQIGTLSETFEAMTTAYQAGYTCVVSHRSGETEDTFIADLSVGSGSGQIKTGSLSRSERVAKYNQLLRIEEKLGSHFAGKKAFSQFDK